MFKKLFLFLFAFGLLNVNAQDNPTKIYKAKAVFSMYGVPSGTIGFSSLEPASLCINKITGFTYRWSGTSWYKCDSLFNMGTGAVGPQGPIGPQGVQGITGAQGIQGLQGINGTTPTFQSGTATSLAYGSTPTINLRTVTANTYALDVGIPAGQPGTGGTSSAGGVYANESPEYYLAYHGNRTFSQDYTQAKFDTLKGGVFKNNGVLLTDQRDYGAIVAALAQAPHCSSIMFKGKYYINRSVQVPVLKTLWLSGGEFWATNQNTFDFFGRALPADNNTAMVWAIYKIYCSNMNAMGNGVGLNQTFLNINSNFGARYDNIVVENMAEAIRMTFQINVVCINCYATGCTRGFTVDWITGFNPATFQSNHVYFIAPRVIGLARVGTTSPTEYGIKFDQVSGGVVDHGIFEGKSMQSGIIVTCNNSTVVSDFTCIRTHFECEQGADVAFLNIINLRQGIVILDGAFGQYPTLLIKCTAGSGTPNITVTNVAYWVTTTSGKAFDNTGCNFSFVRNSGIMYDKPNLTGLFNGNNTIECVGDRCGINKFAFEGLPSSIGGSSGRREVGMPEDVTLSMLPIGDTLYNNKPTKKIVLIYLRAGNEITRSEVFNSWVDGSIAMQRELTSRDLWNSYYYSSTTAVGRLLRKIF